jgi:hypothetical protein
MTAVTEGLRLRFSVGMEGFSLVLEGFSVRMEGFSVVLDTYVCIHT